MAENTEIKFTIDDRELTVSPGTLVIEAARRAGIEVPSFCYYPGLSLQAACRMCLVEVEKAPKLQTACTLVALNGMVVRTNTSQVHQARRSTLEFLLTNHPLDCPVCDKGGECELQDMVFRYGADRSRFIEEKLHTPEMKWSNLVYYDAPRCILCFRCVRVCDEGMDVKALGVGFRGAQSVIIPNRQDHLECEECGMCIDICPVGALTSGTYRYHTRPWEMRYVPTTCSHCSNGCKTTLSVRNNVIIRANNRDLSGINGEFLCAKGRFGFDFNYHPERLTRPLIRKNGTLETATWEDALMEVASRLATIRGESGPDAIAFYGSNRLTNEENYLFGRIARASVGTNHIDHHRTADYPGLITMVSHLAANSGSHGSASDLFASISGLAVAPAILLIGNNLTQQNPLVAWQVRNAIRQHGARLYTVNSGDSKLARKATVNLEASEGQEPAILAALAESAPASDAQLQTLRKSLAGESDLVVLFGSVIQGSAMQALADFIMSRAAQGQRTRLMALGDYANSRGAADMGILSDRLPGYRYVDDEGARELFGRLWGANLPRVRGMDAPAILDASLSGNIKALYVAGANPLKNLQPRPSERFGRLGLLVVQDLYLSETARAADIVLPALSAYEKDGTMTNTAGEVQLTRKAGDFAGARSDFDIFRILSHQLARNGVGQPIPLRTPEATFDEIRRHVPGYTIDWTNLLAGHAEFSLPTSSPNGHAPEPLRPGVVTSNQDSLFSSGSLTQYCRTIQSLREADAKL